MLQGRNIAVVYAEEVPYARILELDARIRREQPSFMNVYGVR